MDLEAASLCDLLMRIVLDGNKDPTNLPIWLLKSITNNFSDDQHIGHGGFADVYKGDLRNGIIIAVKKLKMKMNTSEMVEVNEMKFNQEVDSLMKVNHKNIVKFLGYCSDTQGEVCKHDGKNIMAEKRQRFLCFEFLKEGSLDKYISDASEGLGWRTRYKIIRGICEGLHYLHSKKMVHYDLKPANILLDHKMVPKICDFGLARTFDEQQTRAITKMVFGSSGYMAPESFHGLITFKSDIYSLGVIIGEILEGPGPKVDLSIDNVLESWSARFFASKEGTWLEHVRVCAEIGLQCVDYDQVKRPSMVEIIKKLDELESTHGFIGTDDDIVSLVMVPFHNCESCNLAGIICCKENLFYGGAGYPRPLEVCFPWVENRCIEYPVTLINKTDKDVGVWITPTYPDTCSGSSLDFPYLWEPQSKDADKGSTLYRRLNRRFSVTIFLTLTEQQQRPLEAHIFDVVMFAPSLKAPKFDLYALKHELTKNYINSEGLLEKVKETVAVVYRATLSAVTCSDSPRGLEVAVVPQDVVTDQLLGQEGLRAINSMDMHPTETWVLLGHNFEKVSIWNYRTQERVLVLVVTDFFHKLLWKRARITSTKFVARKQWLVAGDDDGSVHVYAYTTNDRVKKLKGHSGETVTALAFHPWNTLLLTAAGRSIKMWDWGDGWTCVRVLALNASVSGLTVGPRGTSRYAFVDNGDLQVWGFYVSDAVAAYIDYWNPNFHTSQRPFFAAIMRKYLGYQIWDMQTEKYIHTLESRTMDVIEVACHPTLPILATIMCNCCSYGSGKIYTFLWDTRTYRLLKSLELHTDDYRYIEHIVFDGTEDLIRILALTNGKISVIETSLPLLKTELLTIPVAGSELIN